jgi:hypothetical protein
MEEQQQTSPATKQTFALYLGMFFRKDSIVAVKIALKVSSFKIATRLSITVSFAVNSFIGRAKLTAAVNAPFRNSLLVIPIASGSL